jgi:hypothetical protein
MIVTDLRNAPTLAAAAEGIDRSAPAAPAAPRAAAGRSPLLAGIAPARPLAIARSPARARKTRSARSSPAGWAQPKAAAKATTAAKATGASKASTTAKASGSSSKSSASDPLAFLKDKSLSIEDKLMKLLGYMNDRWEKEMQAKMDQIAASEAEKKKPATKSSSSGGGGVFGSVFDAVQKVVAPAAGLVGTVAKLPGVPDLVGKVVTDLGGPVLAAGATALGFPEFAPALLKLGPEIGKAAKSLLAGADAQKPKSSGSSSGSSKALSDAEQQMVMMDIQRIQERQKEMFGLVSNVLKASHDTRMSVVNNIR